MFVVAPWQGRERQTLVALSSQLPALPPRHCTNALSAQLDLQAIIVGRMNLLGTCYAMNG
jgi:hypothetical protein